MCVCLFLCVDYTGFQQPFSSCCGTVERLHRTSRKSSDCLAQTEPLLRRKESLLERHTCALGVYMTPETKANTPNFCIYEDIEVFILCCNILTKFHTINWACKKILVSISEGENPKSCQRLSVKILCWVCYRIAASNSEETRMHSLGINIFYI